LLQKIFLDANMIGKRICFSIVDFLVSLLVMAETIHFSGVLSPQSRLAASE
jgi:hypothetical protein